MTFSSCVWKPTDRNIKALLRKLKAQIKDYFDSEYKLNDFKLTRIDYTVNIDIGCRKNVSDYIKILHSMGKVKGFVPKYKKSIPNNEVFFRNYNENMPST